MFLHFSNDEQMNFQINRALMSVLSEPALPPQTDENARTLADQNARTLAEITAAASKITDMASWSATWWAAAEKARTEQRFKHAAAYYRMAEFYLPDTSVRKEECYRLFRECFDLAYREDSMERFEVPYQNTYLPAIRLKARPGSAPHLCSSDIVSPPNLRSAENERGVILIHGGYDSFMEEFYPLLKEYPDKGYTILLFEGPGQGQARKNGLVFTYEWEKPVKAILDYFHLSSVTILGISWGGYLAPRAAAFDKRIHYVICCDIFYWGLDLILSRLSPLKGTVLRLLLLTGRRELINSLIRRKMESDLDLNWKITHGMYITGTTAPYDFLKNIECHRLTDCISLVTQDVLLLAGACDQYVPVKRMRQIERKLTHASSVTSRIFTASEGGEQHCQGGGFNLARTEIETFLSSTVT